MIIEDSNNNICDKIVRIMIECFRESQLTSLLYDQIGGNCKTRALLCLKPQTEHNVLTVSINLCKQLVNVLNYPIRNDITSQVNKITK